MRTKTSNMDELTAKIYLAAAHDLVSRKINSSVETHLAKTLCITVKTIMDRKLKGNWWFAEVKKAADAFRSDELNEYLTVQFNQTKG